jgi:ribonuclease Z
MLDILRMNITKELLRKMAKEERCLFLALGQASNQVNALWKLVITLDVVVRMLAGLWGKGRAPIPLELVPLTEGRVLDAGEFTVECFPVRHRDTDSFGFCFQSPVRHHLRPQSLAVLGVTDGPVRKELAEGRAVTLADGRTIDPEDVLGPPEGRRRWP